MVVCTTAAQGFQQPKAGEGKRSVRVVANWRAQPPRTQQAQARPLAADLTRGRSRRCRGGRAAQPAIEGP
eukprot:8961192-Alexandrium_andersonii.AAC.1